MASQGRVEQGTLFSPLPTQWGEQLPPVPQEDPSFLTLHQHTGLLNTASQRAASQDPDSHLGPLTIQPYRKPAPSTAEARSDVLVGQEKIYEDSLF